MNNKEIPQIHYTRDYEIFKFFNANRQTSKIHVENIADNDDFLDNFPTCPIIVNENYEIIDGQHRFEAAKSLDCGIYYIVKKGGKVSDILNRNITQRSWQPGDFLNFYVVSGNPNYQKFKTIITDNGMSISQGIAIISAMKGLHQKTMTNIFRSGNMQIENICDKFNEFSTLLFQFYRQFGSIKGKVDLSAIITLAYVGAFYDFFNDHPKRFERLLKQFLITAMEAPFCARKAQAAKILEKIYYWRPQSKFHLTPDFSNVEIMETANA